MCTPAMYSYSISKDIYQGLVYLLYTVKDEHDFCVYIAAIVVYKSPLVILFHIRSFFISPDDLHPPLICQFFHSFAALP